MSKPYCRMLSEHRADLEDEVFLRLSVSGALHQHIVPADLLRERVARLTTAFLDSLEGHPEAFTNYVEGITAERIDEGIRLHELQLALQALEEKVWQLIEEYVPQAEQVSCLAGITTVIGTAKDRIAHVYLHHLECIEAALEFARHNRVTMTTESGPVAESDLNWQCGSVHGHATLV